MKKLKTLLLLSCMVIVCILPSCMASYLEVKGIAYQSIQASNAENQSDHIKDAKIVVSYDIDIHGNIDVTVENKTDEIMTIDRTKSFFRGCNGISTIYYDPTVNVLSQSSTSSSASGASINLGSVARAVGVGGVAGALLSGVNLGGASGEATTTTNTTYIVDQPKLSIAPHGKASMGRVFHETCFDIDRMADLAQHSTSDINHVYDERLSPYTCAVTVSFSIDDEETYDKIETKLYSNSIIVSHVKRTGYVNEALRAVYMAKSDLFEEKWYILCFGGETWSGRGLSGTKGAKDEYYNAYKYNHSMFYNY